MTTQFESLKELMKKNEKRRNHTSLDEFVKEEGI